MSLPPSLPSGPATRSVAWDSKTTKRPSSLMSGTPLQPFPGPPAGAWDTSVVTPVARSRRSTCESTAPPREPISLVATVENTTKRPSPLNRGCWLDPSDARPSGLALSRLIVPVARSRT